MSRIRRALPLTLYTLAGVVLDPEVVADGHQLLAHLELGAVQAPVAKPHRRPFVVPESNASPSGRASPAGMTHNHAGFRQAPLLRGDDGTSHRCCAIYPASRGQSGERGRSDGSASSARVEASVPGAAIGILREGAVTTAYYGVADVTTGEPVTAETRFSVGSLTKSMVATVIARLAEAGRLSLDDPVAAHVPELRGSGWADARPCETFWRIAPGFRCAPGWSSTSTGREQDDDGALAGWPQDVAAAAPAGTHSGRTRTSGWCVLGRAIETVTDATWEDAMRRHLSTRGHARDDLRDRRSSTDGAHRGTRSRPDGPVPVEPLVARAYGPAGTSVVSTVADLLRFAALHLEDPSLAALRAVHADVSIYGWLDSWCLGWARFDWEGGRVWGWDGLVNGERSVLRIVPEHHGRRRPADQQQHRAGDVPLALRRADGVAVRDRRPAAAPRPVARCGRRPLALRRRLRLAGPRVEVTATGADS